MKMKSCWCQAPQILTRISRRIVNNLMVKFMMNHNQCNTISDFDTKYKKHDAKIVVRQITQIMQITSRRIQREKKREIKTKLKIYANNEEINNLNATLYTKTKCKLNKYSWSKLPSRCARITFDTIHVTFFIRTKWFQFRFENIETRSFL